VERLEQLILDLKGTVDSTAANVTRLEQSLTDTRSNLEHLITDVKDSLKREMHQGFALVNARLDTQGARLDRQAGTRWSSKMDAWAEKIDTAFEAKEREIAELRDRVLKLERKIA
jgi:hypothetical protein